MYRNPLPIKIATEKLFGKIGTENSNTFSIENIMD